MGMTGFKVMDSDGAMDFTSVVKYWLMTFYEGNGRTIALIESFFENGYRTNVEIIYIFTTFIALRGKESIFKALLYDAGNNEFNFCVPVNVFGYLMMQAEVPADALNDIFMAMKLATEQEIKELEPGNDPCYIELHRVLNVIEVYKGNEHAVTNGMLD